MRARRLGQAYGRHGKHGFDLGRRRTRSGTGAITTTRRPGFTTSTAGIIIQNGEGFYTLTAFKAGGRPAYA